MYVGYTKYSGPLLIAYPQDQPTKQNIPLSKFFNSMSYVNSGIYGGSRDIRSQCNGSLLKKGDIDILCTF